MALEQLQTDQIYLTNAAANAVRDLMNKRDLTGYALRVFISGGGCSGYQYGMALDNNIRDEDLSFEFDNVKVVVDEISINYLRGATVDYIDDVRGSGFKIENPNVISSCGSCGSSSSTEDACSSVSGGCSGC